ncbi:hypothetical protein GS504_15965 [Rhodococcus hoagii]|nr:hypothetical protein [Prescottella equi]NKS58949.1 hypothetical protein [Prescottella equi]NKS69387.1 hypothetical protein [Prescottella equi]
MSMSLDDIKLPVDHDRTIAEYRHLREGHVPHESACKRLGVTTSGFEQICRRRGITTVDGEPDLRTMGHIR